MSNPETPSDAPHTPDPDEALVERVARAIYPHLVEGTDYDEVPIHEAITRPRYRHLWERALRAADAALAAMPSACPAGEWRPIETCPRDGTDFLAMDEGGDMYRCAFEIAGDEAYFSVRCGQPVVYSPEPTHWQPLPAPPAAHAPETAAEESPYAPR